jgi:hypothetical protein
MFAYFNGVLFNVAWTKYVFVVRLATGHSFLNKLKKKEEEEEGSRQEPPG